MSSTLYVQLEIPENKKISSNTLFGQYGKNWIEENKACFSEKTYSRYLELFRRIDEGIGHIPIGKLEPYHIKCFLDNLRQDGVNKRNGGKLSEKTVLHHYRLISVILRQACREELISKNPASKEYIRSPKNIQKEIKILQPNEVDVLISELQSAPPKWKTAILLLLTGIRRGELCGLEWSDIDFKNKTMSIMRSSLYSPEKGIYTKETKTEGSYRTFFISDKVITLLSEYKKISHTKRLFVQANGSPIHPDSVTDFLIKFSVKNLGRKVTPHILRHTYVSLLIASGVSIKEISRRVGHSKLSTTCNIYSHCVDIADRTAAQALDYLL